MNIDKDKVERETRAQLNNRHKQELRVRLYIFFIYNFWFENEKKWKLTFKKKNPKKLEQSNTQTIKSASKKGGKSAKLAATADAEEKIKELNTKHEKEVNFF